MLRLNEMFAAIQGEGILVGTPSIFIRTHGCNLSCSWCDTPETSLEQASEHNKPYKAQPEDIFTYIRERWPGVSNVVVTGGEPMLQSKDVTHLLKWIGDTYHITMESNGQFYPTSPQVLAYINLLSLSPKLFEPDWTTPTVLLAEHCRQSSGGARQVKIVVETEADVVDAVDRFRELKHMTPQHVDFISIIQPESGKGPEWASRVAELVTTDRRKLKVRVIPQVHKYMGVR